MFSCQLETFKDSEQTIKVDEKPSITELEDETGAHPEIKVAEKPFVNFAPLTQSLICENETPKQSPFQTLQPEDSLLEGELTNRTDNRD